MSTDVFGFRDWVEKTLTDNEGVASRGAAKITFCYTQDMYLQQRMTQSQC